MSTVTPTYVLDTVHSTASFAVKHMVVSTFRAEFDQIEATYDPAAGVLTGRVPVESVRLRDENLRGHLYAEDFFDVANHPAIEFVSTKIERTDGENVAVTGNLTIKGITREVTGTGRITEPTEDPFGGVRLGVELETVLDRTQFGLNWNQPLPKGGFALADEVALNIHLEFSQQA